MPFTSPFGVPVVQPTSTETTKLQTKQSGDTTTTTTTPITSSQPYSSNLLAGATTLNILQPSKTTTVTSSSGIEAATPITAITQASALPTSVNTGQTIASQLAAGGTVTGAIIVNAQGQVIGGDAPVGSHVVTTPGSGGGAPSSVVYSPSGQVITPSAQTTIQLAPTATATSPFASTFGQSSLGSATNAFLNAAGKSAFNSEAGGQLAAQGTAGGSPPAPISIIGAKVSDIQQVNTNNYTATVTLADGTVLKNQQINVPVTYNQQIYANGGQAPTALVQQIALGNLVGQYLTYGAGQAPQPTTSKINVADLLSSAGVQIGLNTFVPSGNPATTQPTLTLQYSASGQPLGFIGTNSENQLGELGLSIPSLSASAEGYTFILQPDGGIQILQNGQVVGNPVLESVLGGTPLPTTLTPVQGVLGGNYPAQLANGLTTAQPGQTFINVGGQQVPISFGTQTSQPTLSGPQAFLAQQAAQQQTASKDRLALLGLSPIGQKLQLTQNNAVLSPTQLPTSPLPIATTFGSPLSLATSLGTPLYDVAASGINNYLQNLNSPDSKLKAAMLAGLIQQLSQQSQNQANNIPIGSTGYNVNINPGSYVPAGQAAALSVPASYRILLRKQKM